MIGLFDSGSGGLTIFKACAARLPDQPFLYLGDHGRAPYGHRDNREILAFTTEMVETLFGQGCRLVVLACNTAAAVALRTIQQDWLPKHYPEHRVLGVLVPTVEALSGVPWHQTEPDERDDEPHRTIALFATTKTVEARSYVEEVAKRAPRTRIVQQACPGLVAAIEDGASPAALSQAVKRHVDALYGQVAPEEIDGVVLGCTHFPLVEAAFRTRLPDGVPIVSQPAIVADSLAAYLARHPRFADTSAGGVRLLTTGDRRAADTVGGRLAGLAHRFDRLPAPTGARRATG